ncbi:MAG: hypothetical protein K9M10_02930 [Candidatus Pacebacteria bacterium]|nr:hypothetical protein [Candidatus Paceibacterota bacterium]MCF7857407.1 hypothetical protein [Candidatus Paceibacterota bacterium]
MSSKKMYLNVVIATIVTAGLLSAVTVLISPRADSSASDNVSGYAWSENIGWISFNSTDAGGGPYGVSVASGGAISGYAWSENIGWISFNSSDVSGCPNGTCSPSVNQGTGEVTGWARVLSAVAAGANSGGWDGFISLSGTGPNYGVKVTGCTWSGWAWGSDVVGWISFDSSDSGAGGGPYGVIGTSNACVPAIPICTGTIPTDATSCAPAVQPPTDVAYRLVDQSDCSFGGINKCHYSCDSGYVIDVAGTSCVKSQCNDGDDNEPDGKTDYPDDPGCTDLSDDNETDLPPTLTISPRVVEKGSTANISWILNGQTGCSITGGGNAFDLSSGVDASSIITINARTKYVISCPVGSATSTVEIIPKGFET